jgi:hypothetical protein
MHWYVVWTVDETVEEYYGQRHRIRLVELLITKHIFLFKNLKPSYEDDHVSVCIAAERSGSATSRSCGGHATARNDMCVSVRSSHDFNRLKLQEIPVADATVPDECRMQARMGPYPIRDRSRKCVHRGFLRVHHQIDYLRCQTDFIILIVDNRSISLNLALGPIPLLALLLYKSRKRVSCFLTVLHPV